MLRRRLTWGFVLAAALCVAAPSFTQTTNEFGQKLDEAEKKLDANIKACKPIKPGDYLNLWSEAGRNSKTAMNAAKAGAPLDREVAKTLTAQQNRAHDLWVRAEEAARKQCPPPQQPQAAPPPQQPQTPPPDPFKQLENDSDSALDDLDDAMDDCDEAAVQALIPELEQLAKQAHDVADTAKAAGALSRIDAKEAGTLASDLDKAIAAAKKFKCTGKKTSYFRYTPIELDPFEERLLAIHNKERSAVYARPLKWNFKLEWDAIGYADHLAQIRDLVHAPREGRGIERENLAQTLIGWSPDQMLGVWVTEKSDFVPGYFPNVARDGNLVRVLHYTQMIWPTTTDLGCGYVEGGGYGWLVCRYSPGGNRDGEPVGPLFRQPERG